MNIKNIVREKGFYILLFVGSIFITYMVYLELGAGLSDSGNSVEYQISNLTEIQLETETSDQSRVLNGKTVYMKYCVACHGVEGQGTIGPNLVDSFWIHGAQLSEIMSVVEEGVPEKGMMSWKKILPLESRINVIAYLRSMYGSSPTRAKLPEGERIIEKWMK